jgi:hypothetical protein
MLPGHLWSDLNAAATAVRSSARKAADPSRFANGKKTRRETAMRSGDGRRLAWAGFFALLAGVTVAWANPVDRLKADLRADARGLVISFEYAAKSVEG